VTVTNNVVPDFATTLAICTGSAAPTLNNTSPNGIIGIWNPSVISNTTSGNYIFTPNAGQCASPVTLAVTVGNNIVPDFATSLAVCTGAAVPTLNNTSPNGIVGSWSPSVISNTTSGNYVFTPNAGQCASPVTLTVIVGNNIIPDFATSLAVCTGAAVPSLNNTSPNGISGSWNPSGISNTTSGNYIFTPNAGQCASPVTLAVTVGNNIVPDFATSLAVCTGASVPTLNNTSPNGIIGSWNPSVISNTTSGNYVFTPNVGQCASPITLAVTVGNAITPVTAFTYTTPACHNASPITPTTAPGFTTGGQFSSDAGLSINPTSGQINLAASTEGSHTITYTVNAGACTVNGQHSFTIAIAPAPVPSLSGNHAYCVGTAATLAADIPGGTWQSDNPSVVAIDSAGNLTALLPGQSVITYSIGGNCPVQATKTISVYPIENPSITGGFICIDNTTGSALAPLLLQTGIPNPGHTFFWTHNGDPLPSTGNFHLATQPGDYEVLVTNTITGCQSSASATVGVSSMAVAEATIAQDFSHQQTITVTITGGSGQYQYQLDDGPFQISNVFHGISEGEHVIVVNDIRGCDDLVLTVYALDFPRFFTPNGDGTNDYWMIDGLAQQHSAIYIFDRYGKLLKQLITGSNIGWDGNYNGEPMPSSDYWFKIEYRDRFGHPKEFRSHFSLKR
jgi:gliding motility-associated-like protein